jgi:hypothetical protein
MIVFSFFSRITVVAKLTAGKDTGILTAEWSFSFHC